jgi:hypothetical protein
MSIKNNIKQIIIWGHKLHSHTHSYIHYGFEKAFKHLGYQTYWLDNSDNITGINFDNSLFITEGQVDSNIPINPTSYYVLHNCNFDKYKTLDPTKILTLQVFTLDAHKYKAKPIKNTIGCYCLSDCIFIPWATDLLPHEIDNNINNLNNILNSKDNNVYLVGMPIYPWDEVQMYCLANGLKYNQVGGFSKNNVDSAENMRLIQNSKLAPSVQNQWQAEHGYIPCRIFKNISYGKMGLTNNKTVMELFENKILYSENIHTLMNLGLEFENKDLEYKKSILIPLMENIKNNHTYLNRIDLIFRYFDSNL